jgi:hypothetical protein
MTATRKGLWQAIVTTTLVAIGVAVLLGLALGFTGSLVASLGRSERYIEEDVTITADGRPVINMQSSELGSIVTLNRRTLDGQEFPVDYRNWLWFTSLMNRVPPPGVIYVPPRWEFGGRMLGGTDGRRPPAAWYLIRDGAQLGHCYFAGFDGLSKLPVGFIGRDGFQASLPAVDAQFVLPDTNQTLWSFIATSQGFQQGIVYDHDIYSRGPMAGWHVYLIESDKLWDVDLRQRSARKLQDFPNLVSISLTTTLNSIVDSLPAPDKEAARQHATPFRFAAATQDVLYNTFQANQPTASFQPIPPTATFQLVPSTADADAAPNEPEPKYASALALRTDDKIILYNPQTGGQRDFVLPEQIRSAQMDIAWIATEKLLLKTQPGFWSGGAINKLWWIDTAGKIEREVELKLAGWRPETPRQVAWRNFNVAQVPIAWLFGVLVVAPLVMLQNHSAPYYISALTQTFHVTWIPLVLVLVLAAVFAWLTIRLQHKYRRPWTREWAAFVFLLGPAGFIAYVLQNRRPKLQACAECGEVVPRNRDACAACSTPFPAPPRVGTEVLA